MKKLAKLTFVLVILVLHQLNAFAISFKGTWTFTPSNSNSFPNYEITFSLPGNTNFSGVEVFYYSVVAAGRQNGSSLRGYSIGETLFFFVPYSSGVSFIRAKISQRSKTGVYTETFSSNATGQETNVTTGRITLNK